MDPPPRRDYKAGTAVVQFYADLHGGLTRERGVAELAKLQRHLAEGAVRRDLFSVLRRMNGVVDPSDPDFGGAQLNHCIQTAENLRAMVRENPSLPDWLPLVGLIHDVGKVLAQLAPDLDEALVLGGDSWPLDVPAGASTVLRDVGFEDNPDYPGIESADHSGKRGVGLSNLTWWGHDEAMYWVLISSATRLPPAALRMVRFHSCYSWHQGRDYWEYADSSDVEALGWLQLFQKSDLYSKDDSVQEAELDMEYYGGLEKKYLPNGLLM